MKTVENFCTAKKILQGRTLNFPSFLDIHMHIHDLEIVRPLQVILTNLRSKMYNTFFLKREKMSNGFRRRKVQIIIGQV